MIHIGSTGEKYIAVQLGETERDIIDQMTELALENNGGCITKAAITLGINRSTLQMRLRKKSLNYANHSIKKFQTQ